MTTEAADYFAFQPPSTGQPLYPSTRNTNVPLASVLVLAGEMASATGQLPLVSMLACARSWTGRAAVLDSLLEEFLAHLFQEGAAITEFVQNRRISNWFWTSVLNLLVLDCHDPCV